MTPRHRIDCHSHYLPDFYREALEKYGHSHPDGMPAVPHWSEEDHLALMDELNITTSIISISSPGVHLVPGNDELAIDLARKCNKYACDLKKKHASTKRFGVFATMPLPNVEASIAELDNAYEEGADGVGLHTNYHGVYLGDPRLDPFMAELNARKSIVHVHPSTGCVGTTRVNPLSHMLPAPALEFFFDTARALTSLILNGTLQKYPSITWIFSHLGGAFPPLVGRVTMFSKLVPTEGLAECTEDELLQIFNERVYFDTAGLAFPTQWKGLVQSAGVGYDRLVYGSDFPFTTKEGVRKLAGIMDDCTGRDGEWTEERIEEAWSGNALELFRLGEGDGESEALAKI